MGMNLEELVRLTLNNIVEGSVGAQVYASEAGAVIGAGGDGELAVEFDVAVHSDLVDRTTAPTGRRISVLDAADVEEGDPVTRVRFSIPVRLPAQASADSLKSKARAKVQA